MTDLANRAIDALAAVRQIEPPADHPMRHQVRTLKRLAEANLSDAFNIAHNLAVAAQQVVSDYDKAAGKEGGGA